MGEDKLDVGFVRDLINDIECCDYQPVELHIEHVGKILLPKEYSAVVDAYKKHYDLMTNLFLGHAVLSVEEIKSQYKFALASAPATDFENNQFFRPVVNGLISRSVTLLSMLILPSSR